MGIPHGESGKTMGIDVVTEGHPPGQRSQNQTESGSVVGSGTKPNAPKK